LGPDFSIFHGAGMNLELNFCQKTGAGARAGIYITLQSKNESMIFVVYADF